MRPRSVRLGSFALVAGMLATMMAFGGTTASADPLACDGAEAAGCWTAPFSEFGMFDAQPPQTVEDAGKLPTAVSAAVTPKGRIVYWDGLSGLQDSNASLTFDAGRTADPDRSRVLDLSGTSPVWVTPTPETGGSPENMFCADQRLLANGKVVVAGGTKFETEEYADFPDDVTGPNGPDGLAELYGSKHTRLFTDSDGNSATWDWSEAANMKHGRWYPTLITQADGKLLVAGGVSKLLWNSNTLPGNAGARASGPLPVNVNQTETYDPATGTWSENGATAEQTLPLFARLHLLPNGQIFYPAVGQMWGPAGEAIDELNWNFYRAFDPGTKTWKEIGRGGFGARNGAFSQMLRLEPNADGVYDKVELIVGGGTLGVSPGLYTGQAFSERITLTNSDPADADWESVVTRTGDMNSRRWYSSGVGLPNGQILAFSGADKDEVVLPGTEFPVRMAEVFNPKMQADSTTTPPGSPVIGRWLAVAQAERDRTYHNSALLLPDGSVLVGGHAPINKLYGGQGDGTNDDQRIFANNLRDPSFERFYPPYLYQGARPDVLGTNVAATYGGTINVSVAEDSEPVKEIVITRLPSVTHTTDADARTVKLNFIPSGNEGALQATVPTNPAVVPPGYYYVFALSEAGVPSEATIIKIDDGVQSQGWTHPVKIGTQPVRDAVTPSKGGTEGTRVARTQPGAVADLPTTVLTEARSVARSARGSTGTSPLWLVALGTIGIAAIGSRARKALRARA